jgi:uncharacterized protein
LCINTKEKIKFQFLGFLNTPQLWHGNLVGLNQINNLVKNDLFPPQLSNKKIRLGHLVERFVSKELENIADIKVLAENIQVKNNKITIGELDCLLINNNTPVHLEIVYKFYLYDESVGNSEIEHWIGPNRNDSLIEKITKLKNKQLPLLYRLETEPIIEKFKLNINTIQQQVYFKAQLFVPFHLFNKPLRVINNNCIMGYYINFNAINKLKNNQFYIPSKLDWLVEPHSNVDWMNFEAATAQIKDFTTNKRSPLCWIIDKNSALQKIFIVWWEHN